MWRDYTEWEKEKDDWNEFLMKEPERPIKTEKVRTSNKVNYSSADFSNLNKSNLHQQTIEEFMSM